MWQRDHRVLHDFGISPGDWAVLFAASYYIPVTREHFIDLAVLESDGDIAEEELEEAFDRCLANGWVGSTTSERHDEVESEFMLSGSNYPEQGIVLTNRGAELKERITEVLLETVTLA